MNKRQIKQIRILSLKYSDEIKKHLLTSREVEIIRLVLANKGIFSGEIASSLDVSIQSATSSLKSLYDQNRLTRVDKGDPAGGSHYFYTYNQEE